MWSCSRALRLRLRQGRAILSRQWEADYSIPVMRGSDLLWAALDSDERKFSYQCHSRRAAAAAAEV